MDETAEYYKRKQEEAGYPSETTESKSAFSDGLCAKTQADLKGEILDRMNYFYLQTDGTHKWPNNAEGDLLKMAHKFISA